MNEETQSLKILLTHFEWSLRRMEESFKNEPTEYFRGAALERFRLTFDLAIKCIKAFAHNQKTPCESTHHCFEWAEKNGLLDSEVNWKGMVEVYDKIKQRPKGKTEEDTYDKLSNYYSVLLKIKSRLTAKLS